jgi:hypothetical protein
VIGAAGQGCAFANRRWALSRANPWTLVPTACQLPHLAAAQPHATLGLSRRYSLPVSTMRVSRQSSDQIRRLKIEASCRTPTPNTREPSTKETMAVPCYLCCHAIGKIGAAAAGQQKHEHEP